jgi:LPS-assembly protein
MFPLVCRQIFRYSSVSCLLLLVTLPCLAQSAETNTAPALLTGESDEITCPVIVIPEINAKRASDNEQDITIMAKNAMVQRNKMATFSGDVIMLKQQQKIKANHVIFDRQQAKFTAEGDIHYQDQGVNVFAETLSAGGKQNITEMNQAAYHIANTAGHGKADNIAISQKGQLTLSSSSFTTCPSDQPDWQLSASEIVISADENFGEAYNAKFELFDVPILYLPYFNFPVTDKRKSGFLYPQISSTSRSGLEIKTPFYWNIAPNYDATITPRYLSKRGVELMAQLRYLINQQSGMFDIEYLPNDNDQASDEARYLARYQHIGTFSDNFRAHIDYTTLSDDAYLVDIGSDHYKATDAYLYQVGEISYFANQWQSTLRVQDFEVIGNHQPSYRTLPQLEISGFQPLPFAKAQLDFYSEISHFSSTDEQKPVANRYHVETGISLPYASPAWFLNTELKLMHTEYQQWNLTEESPLAESVSRTLPKVRLHAGMNFDRFTTLFGDDYTQTLEPQLQYLYLPKKDQQAIGLYDTSLLQDDYNGLFRDVRFSGLDRIADANQITWGLTSRLLNQNNQERFRLSVGKIVYLNQQNTVGLTDNILADQSALAADLFVRLGKNWQFSSDIQYATDAALTNKSQTRLDYRFDQRHVIQLSHRFNRTIANTSIEQASVLASVALSKHWQFVGRATQDLREKRNLESYIGFQYDSCCWAFRVAYHRNIDTNLNQQNFLDNSTTEFNNGVMLQFVIKGLGSKQSTLSTDDMLSKSIFGYKRPYFLNN